MMERIEENALQDLHTISQNEFQNGKTNASEEYINSGENGVCCKGDKSY